ncbi:hypothetical protein KAU45_09380, partial [bacterium]|nr:hypothetical protein [bacterium]
GAFGLLTGGQPCRFGGRSSAAPRVRLNQVFIPRRGRTQRANTNQPARMTRTINRSAVSG